MLVFSFPFFPLNLFSGVLVESRSFQGSVASPLVGCKPKGFRTVANTATLFSYLRKVSEDKGNVNSYVTVREKRERRVNVQECTINLLGIFYCRVAHETNKDST